jgi:hypothetical protein
VTTDLAGFRGHVREWCQAHVPGDWRRAQTGVGDDEFVTFQKAWFAELHAAGFAVPHWPREWGGGMSVAEQIVLYQELAAHDAPRLVLAFVGIHHAASTLLAAGTEAQRRRHLPAILDGEIWVQGFSEPEAGSDLASLRTTARRVDDGYLVNGQKLWASGGLHADWCLLLARTDQDAPKRKGISYFLMDMTSPGIDVRPIRNAIGESHFCEVFLNDVVIPADHLIGAENAGWQVAQATLGAERGMTMLELAERLGNAGLNRLIEECTRPRPDGSRPIDDDAQRGRGPRLRLRRSRGPVHRQAVLQRTAATADRLRHRGDGHGGPHRAGQTDVQRVGVRRVGARLHRVVGVDDSRRLQRDPAHHHRREGPRPSP